jgi:hypothetical protein
LETPAAEFAPCALLATTRAFSLGDFLAHPAVLGTALALLFFAQALKKPP